MEPTLLRYDPDLRARAHAAVLPLLPEFNDRKSPLSSLVSLFRDQWPGLEDVPGAPPGALPYYVLMEYRDFAPELLPAHDLCLLMANIMLRRMAEHEGGPVILLDWGLLPVAVWLAGAAGAKERPVFLPPAGAEEKDMDRLVEGLERYLPGTVWRPGSGAGEALPRGAWVLAWNPLRHCDRDPRFLSRLEAIAGGMFLTGWDFLGVRIHAHTRSRWLQAGLIESILQLPRPRRQGAIEYPALLTLRPPALDAPLLLARVADCRPGPGGLDQEACLRLLRGGPGDTMKLEPRETAKDGLFTLTPATWLTPRIRVPEGRTLRAFAQVLRCQLPRERLAESDPALEERFGETADGSFIAREISLNERDPMTGFVDEYQGNRVKVALTRLGRQGKYLLQANDIVFAFRGTASSVGQVGFVEEEGAPAITGQSMCIIRALPDMNPVWLYYYLKREQIVEFIRAKASGSGLLTVNLESIRDIPIDLPGREELETITLEHRKISENMAKVARLRREAYESLIKIWSEGNKWEQVRELEALRARDPRPHVIGGGPEPEDRRR